MACLTLANVMEVPLRSRLILAIVSAGVNEGEILAAQVAVLWRAVRNVITISRKALKGRYAATVASITRIRPISAGIC